MINKLLMGRTVSLSFLKKEVEIAIPDKAYALVVKAGTVNGRVSAVPNLDLLKNASVVMVDFYVKRTGNAKQIEITADKFGGNYYLKLLLCSVLPMV